MKNYTLFLIFFGLISCKNEENNNKINELQNQSPNFIYTVLLKSNSKDTVYRQEYLIENGKVIFEKYTNYSDPKYNRLCTFEYDNNGRVIKEIIDNQKVIEIYWDNDTAKVFNKNNDLIYEFHFNSSMQLLSYKYGDKFGARTRFFNYDTNGNVVSGGTEAGIDVEYLDYNTSLNNPFNLINSIAVLRIDYKPNFKNVFKIEKTYPFKGDDYSVPLSYYKYFWTLNNKGLIETMVDEKSLIYVSKFEYK
jgi:hypothetical protein